MERPIPRNDEEKEKLSIIDQICSDDTGTHCLPRLLLDRKEELPRCNLFGNGCHSTNWCTYRQILYERHSARYLAQAKLIEVEEWMLGVKNKKQETYHHALEEFSEGRYGNGTIFAIAWDEYKIRDLESLKRICVYSVIDNTPITNPATEIN